MSNLPFKNPWQNPGGLLFAHLPFERVNPDAATLGFHEGLRISDRLFLRIE
jgi:hypothetical protein